MMITLSSPDLAMLQRRLEQMPITIRRASVKSIKGATLAGQRFAKRLAPKDSGDLKRGIIRRPVMIKGRQVSSALISKVDKTFPYQMWVNENIHTVTLPTVKFHSINKWPTGRWLDKHQSKLRKWRYSDTNHTGVPRYFDLTFEYLKRIYPQFALKELQTELKIAFQK